MRDSRHRYLPSLMWLLPLTFFTYQFILRLWPGLMMHQIMEQFSIDATHFGLLAAFYYYGYSGMQIPVAILLDRFEARNVIFIFAVLCGVSTLLFTITDNFYLALFGRFLIGAGSAVGFLGVSKVVSEWFPKEQYTKMISFSFTFGLMGAVYGGKPVSLWVENYHWYNVSVSLGIVSIIIGVGTYFILRTPAKAESVSEDRQFRITNFKNVLSSPIIWLLAFANLLMVGSLEGFADVWGVGYLMTAYDLTKDDAAGVSSFIFVGMIFGGPILAFFSKKFGNYTVIASCGIGMSCAFILLLSIDSYSSLILPCLFFTVGIMCCYQVIVFAAGADLVGSKQLGVTIAFLNCINMLGGSFFHTLIGKLMDVFWRGAIDMDGVRVYSLETYQYALGAIPFCALIGALIICALAHRRK